MAFQKINPSDKLIDWRNKFNNNLDEIMDMKNRLDILEAGGTTDGELIALRSSTALNFTGATADERIENAEQKILDNESRIAALENKDLKILNVRDFGAVGDGVADDSAAIQSALDAANAAGGGEVYVPDGVYAIKTSLMIYNYTRFRLSPRATLIRAGSFSAILRSGIGNVDGYEGLHDVEVIGGTWDVNARQFPFPSNGIIFGHARNIVVRDLTILDVYQYHAVEYNAVQNGAILNCRFDGYSGTRKSEAIQLDLMKGSAQFDQFGNYDNTPCDNILIYGCTFENWSRGIGTHSATNNIFHTNIRIIGNHFRNLTDEGIRAEQWKCAVIQGNTFENCGGGIEVRPGTGADASESGYQVIKGNVFNQIKGGDYPYAIWLNGDPGVLFVHTVVSDNVIYDTENTGIYVTYVTNSIISNNDIRQTGNHGISVADSTYCVIQGNTVMHAQNHGIVLTTASHNVIQGNICQDNQQVGASVGQANIRLVSNSNYNNIQGNTCRAGSNTDYGISITNTCVGNLVTNNDLYSSGKAAALDNQSGSTVTSAGNRT